MALVHETLYKTGKFSEVDMNIYLRNLVDQVAIAYNSPEKSKILVEIGDVALDVGRATPMGLIINELISNSLKYAFPGGNASCGSDGKQPCEIRVSLSKDKSSYTLRVADNGIGLPPGFDPQKTKTLGLKLVTFLAQHQLRAGIEISTKEGTAFVFRFEE